MSVAGVSIFPVPLTYEEPGIGGFPSEEEAEDFRRHRARKSRGRSGRELTAIVAIPFRGRNGVTIFAEDLVRGLGAQGLSARLLLTEENTPLVTIDQPRLPVPTDIPIEVLSVTGRETWGARWGAMQACLQRHRPCVYLPNFDWRHTGVLPRLPDDVFTVGLVHAADAFYFDYIRRLGPYFDAIVGNPSPGRESVAQGLP